MRSDREGLFVNTGLLRDHVSKLHERKKTAMRLRDCVARMKGADDPMAAYRYDHILRDIAQLVEYFDRMAALLDEISDDAVEVSHKIGDILEESAEDTRYIVNKTFL